MSTSTALSPIQQKVAAVRDMLAKSRDQIAAALPRHVTPERMLRVAMTAIQRTPKLLECDPRGLVGCIVQASQLGLEPDGVLGHAYLVPFNNRKTGRTECQLIPGYKGLVDLSRRSGQISTVYAKVVHAKDKYRIAYGLKPTLEHTPANDDEPGPMIAVYAVAHLRDGGVQYEWMWRREVESIRKRSRAGDSGPWVTDYEEMAKKTVLRRLCKMLPVSVEVQRLVAADEQFDAGVHETATDVVGILPPPAPEPSGMDALAERLDGDSQPDEGQDPAEPAPEPTDAGPSESEVIAQQFHEMIDGAETLGKVLEVETAAATHDKLGEDDIRAIAEHANERRKALRGSRAELSNGGKQTQKPLV